MASVAVLSGAACSRMQRPEDEPFELEEATVATLQQRMEGGLDSATSLVEKYLARIESIDRAGPKINSIIELNPDALAIAQQLDMERRAGQIRGPLHRIPIVTAAGMLGNENGVTLGRGLASVILGVCGSESFVNEVRCVQTQDIHSAGSDIFLLRFSQHEFFKSSVVAQFLF